MYGDKWLDLNDGLAFGGFSASAGVSDVNRSALFGESGVYADSAIRAAGSAAVLRVLPATAALNRVILSAQTSFPTRESSFR
jgi:hypothetical protein